jgi:hypothetical protein
MRVSERFKLGKTQAELDFVDVDTAADTRLFVDPYAIEIRDDELSADLAHHVVTFSEDVLDSLRRGDDIRALELTANLTEPHVPRHVEGQASGPRGRPVQCQ